MQTKIRSGNNRGLKPSQYHDQYLPADTEVVFHEGLEGLDVIRITLPVPPDIRRIEGYGLPPEKQKFQYTELPEKLKRLDAKRFLLVDDYWNEIEKDFDYFKDDLWFIEREWFRRKYGHWVFIKGKPTWIPPWHYMYLNYHKFENEIQGTETPDHPEYRDRDRKLFVGRWYAATTTEAPFRYRYKHGDKWKYTSSDKKKYELEDKGVQVESGPYLVDMGYRTVLGTTEFKPRRGGYTSQCAAISNEIVTRMERAIAGVQSMTEASAKKIWQKNNLNGIKGLPFFFLPIGEGILDPEREMKFKPAGKKKSAEEGKKAKSALYSETTYGSSTVGFFDGWKLKYWLGDEFAKCLAKDTPVLMADGSRKMVQDVVTGDILHGDDGTTRTVLGVSRGREMMYRVKPNKWQEWGCNESHILSMKWCASKRYANGWGKDQVVNLSVREYLQLPKSTQKHLMLYKAGVDYPEKPVNLDPYFLGVWLGDGAHTDPIIHNMDAEVIDWLRGYAKSQGLKLIEKSTKSKAKKLKISAGQGRVSMVKKSLNDYGLIKNKHIPKCYLTNSRENRLLLLAGLLDTDGYRCARKNINYYCVVQKRKALADDIHDLASGLGFNATIKESKAKMKRSDGSRYECQVWRVHIFGNNLHEIPCKVKHKQSQVVAERHKNSRNPLRSGFTLEVVGEGDYYGFTIDGNRLFLLGDYQVTHNTTEVDVLERTLIVRKCLSTGNMRNIIGYSNQVSTAGEFKKGGGSEAKQLTNLSHWGQRNDLGQTDSGYINLFIPSDEGLEGYIDEWGFSMKEEAREAILSRRASLLEKEEWEKLNEEIRQAPLVWKENFISNNKQARFNSYILEKRYADLTVGVNPHVIYGRFAWEKCVNHNYSLRKLPTRADFINKKDRVIFIPEPMYDYSWELSWVPNKDNQNRFIARDDNNSIIPFNIHKISHGVDTFKYGEKTTDGKGSLGGGALFRRYDPVVDNPLIDPLGWNEKTKDFNHVTNRFCGVYLKRPPQLEEFLEQQLMAALFFGCQTFPEMNLKDYYRWVKDRDFPEYLFYDEDVFTGEQKKEPGAHTNTVIINTIFNAWAQHIVQNGLREVHPVLIKQCLEIEDSMRDFDAFTAGGYALMQSSNMREIEVEEQHGFDASEIFLFESLD